MNFDKIQAFIQSKFSSTLQVFSNVLCAANLMNSIILNCVSDKSSDWLLSHHYSFWQLYFNTGNNKRISLNMPNVQIHNTSNYKHFRNIKQNSNPQLFIWSQLPYKPFYTNKAISNPANGCRTCEKSWSRNLIVSNMLFLNIYYKF